jgi:hypothetical protein
MNLWILPLIANSLEDCMLVPGYQHHSPVLRPGTTEKKEILFLPKLFHKCPFSLPY